MLMVVGGDTGLQGVRTRERVGGRKGRREGGGQDKEMSGGERERDGCTCKSSTDEEEEEEGEEDGPRQGLSWSYCLSRVVARGLRGSRGHRGEKASLRGGWSGYRR